MTCRAAPPPARPGSTGRGPGPATASPTARNDAGSRARSSAVPDTKYSGCSLVHGWSGATWLGTKSSTRPTPRAASAARGGGQPGLAAEHLVDGVAADAVGRAHDVGVGDVRQSRPLRRRHRRLGAGDGRAGRAALPDAHQPDGVHAGAGDVVPHLVRHVAQRDRPSQPGAEVVQPDPREQLVDERVRRQLHSCTPRASRAVCTGAIDSPVTRRNGLASGRSSGSSTASGVR